MSDMKNLMILDGNSMINRGYYGVRPLTAPDGTPTNAVFGFMAILRRILDEIRPEALCVAFDLKDPTFRHKAYEGYKAQRRPMPDDLAAQIPVLKELLDAMGIRRYELSGYEADDIIGTVSSLCEKRGWHCTVLTGDKDALQLVSEQTTVCNVKTAKGQTDTILYTPERFTEEYGFAPAQIVDLKALMGDSSDNIPGVPGIGEKTAMELIRRYGTIENIYSDLSALEVKSGVRSKLEDGKESAELSFWLATIFREVPLPFLPEDNLWDENYTSALYPLLKRLGFQKFIEKWRVSPPDAPVMEGNVPAEHLPTIDPASPEEAKTLLEELRGRDTVALSWGDDPDVFEICDGTAVRTIGWNSCGEEFGAILRCIAEKRLISNHVKDVIRYFLTEGLPTDGFVFDTSLAAYLIDATDGDYSDSRLTARYLGEEYTGSEAIWRLYEPLSGKLKEMGMDELYYSAELPLCRVLAEMEKEGFLVDRKALFDFGESLNEQIDQLQSGIWRLAGHEFNINSPKQLGEVLFEELMLPSGKKTKSGWSTSADVLEKLVGKHEIVGQILEYRMLTKLKSTYADGLLKVIGDDGRIHTRFQMTVTATGRLSSTEPNLQNIPIRKTLGAQIRRMFVAAPGNDLVDADYSQIELRLLAHISGDHAMQEAFLSGEDFHSVTASKVFNIPLDEVTPALRSRAKAVNFGVIYGISAFSLAQDIHVRPNEAKEFIDAYLMKYHGVRDYMKEVVEKAKTDGYVKTLYGRRRNLPELKSSNFNMRSFGERVALNMPIQGTAADIMKLAMVNVFRRLKNEGLKARLILQVHDELIVECPESETERVKEIVRQEMEGVASLAVPLSCEAKAGKNWAEAH